MTVAAWTGAGNLGDELLFSALRAELERVALRPVVVSVSPVRTRQEHAGVEVVGTRNLVAATRGTSGMVVGGGGLVQDRTSLVSPLHHCLRPMLAAAGGRPLVGVGLGAEPLRSPTSRWLFGRALRPALEVVARDPGSAAVLRGVGLPRVREGADLAFLLPDRARGSDGDAILVCLAPPVTRGGLVPASWRSGPSSSALHRVAARIAPALAAAARSTGAPVRFLAMDERRDPPLHAAIAAELSCEVEVVRPRPATLLDAFARARVVVAARYHACIAGLLTHRPVVALGYAPKVRALGAVDGSGITVLPYPNTPSDALREALAAAMRRDPEQDAMLARCRDLATANRLAVEGLAAAVT